MTETGLQIQSNVERECRSKWNRPRQDSNLQEKSPLYMFKSQTELDKDVLLCLPSNILSSQAVDYIQTLFSAKCGEGTLEYCRVQPDDFDDLKSIARAVIVRHPFDRLILEFKHRQKMNATASVKTRKILFSRHRSATKKKSRKGSHAFRQFIKSSVLPSNSTIHPLSQVTSLLGKYLHLQKIF